MKTMEEYFNKLINMPVEDIVKYLQDIGIEVEKITPTNGIESKL